MEDEKNLRIFSRSEAFLNRLRDFGILQEGHFEYKGKAQDGKRLHGEYFINFRLLITEQELFLTEFYEHALQEFFGNKKNLLIVGVAMASLILPKVVQLRLFSKMGIEYAYTEKREGILGIFGEQAEKCKGKHLLFIEDVCNNGTSSRELFGEIEQKKELLQIDGFSMLYGVHRGHTFLSEPVGEIYAMAELFAPSYHPDDCPACKKGLPLKKYKK